MTKIHYQVGYYRRTGDPEQPDAFGPGNWFSSYAKASVEAVNLSLMTGRKVYVYAVRLGPSRRRHPETEEPVGYYTVDARSSRARR